MACRKDEYILRPVYKSEAGKVDEKVMGVWRGMDNKAIFTIDSMDQRRYAICLTRGLA